MDGNSGCRRLCVLHLVAERSRGWKQSKDLAQDRGLGKVQGSLIWTRDVLFPGAGMRNADGGVRENEEKQDDAFDSHFRCQERQGGPVMGGPHGGLGPAISCTGTDNG